jgi:acyl-CoA reductase-like NAD-dependent aldehyde dehydrogenase
MSSTTQRTRAGTSRARSPEAAVTPVLPVINPATGAEVGSIELLDAPAVRAAVARARAAQPAWATLGAAGRASVIDRFRHRLLAHRDLMVETLQAESGKTYEDSNADLLVVLAWAQQLAGRAERWLADEHVRSTTVFSVGRRNTITRRAIGVVGVIGPWNVPLTLSIGDALPALLAGNSVVIKPSELTPLSAVLAAKMFVEAGGPPGVLSVVTGDGATGAALVNEVDYLHFTGSDRTGALIAQRAAERMIGCSLELGGKDAMIVLADADLDRAAAGAVHYALFNTGQICMSVERVYVEAPVHDAFVERVIGHVQRLHQATPGGPGTADLSTMISPTQLDIVIDHVQDAVAKGARVAHGGRVTRGAGTFHEPTVLVDVDHTMRCMTDETFGPTIPIMRVANADEAVERANDSRYGLTASVWTGDLKRGESLARRLDVGTVTVNDAMYHLGDVDLPMGGWKRSGMGARNGRQGMLRFTKQTVIQVAHTTLPVDPSWIPYDGRKTKLMGEVYDRLFALPHLPRPTLPRPDRAARRAVRAIIGGLR